MEQFASQAMTCSFDVMAGVGWRRPGLETATSVPEYSLVSNGDVNYFVDHFVLGLWV